MRTWCVLLAGISFLSLARTSAAAPCDGLLDGSRLAEPRMVTPLDLARLRDIGFSGSPPGQKLLALSPDRRQAAFVLMRADPASNRYCSALVVLPLAPGSMPRILDQSDEVLLEPAELRGIRLETGALATEVPKWSPDGSSIAYRKRQDGSTQAWRVPLAGGAAQQVTHAPDDVERIDWSADSNTLFFVTRPALRQAREAHAAEGLRGQLYDNRFEPYAGYAPQLPASTPEVVQAVDLASLAVRALRDTELAHLAAARPLEEVVRGAAAIVAQDGSRAGVARDHAGDDDGPARPWVERPNAARILCPDAFCVASQQSLLPDLWWRDDGRELVFMRREGWAGFSETGLYRWSPETGRVTRLRSGEDKFFGCEMLATQLLCAQESALQPRRLVLIDLETGVQKVLFDPNPDFQTLRLGHVERLRWTNPDGVQSFSDLVLPPDYVPGRRLPLVVSQYTSTGFLRGGTGDELPIQVLASRGFAVLSFQVPLRPHLKRIGTDPEAAHWKGWAVRERILSALEHALQMTVARGVADPKKFGLWGLSDGASTVQYALVNRPALFAAASAAAGFFEPQLVFAYAGVGVADQFRNRSFPPPRGPGSESWKKMSIAMNADRIRAPLLMQEGDHELILFLESYAGLRDAGKPAELYSFPDAYHLKWQPAQRLALYERNLDWFSFWLEGTEDPDPAKAAQYQRWRAMREKQTKAKGKGGA